MTFKIHLKIKQIFYRIKIIKFLVYNKIKLTHKMIKLLNYYNYKNNQKNYKNLIKQIINNKLNKNKIFNYNRYNLKILNKH